MKKKIAENDLKKLSRIDLLEIMVEQETEIERLRTELDEANRKLEDRRTRMESAGSIAEAALKVSGVFEAAQQAADQYLTELKELKEKQERLYLEKEAECNAEIKKMLEETARFCEQKKERAINNEVKEREKTDNSRVDYDPVSFWADLFQSS